MDRYGPKHVELTLIHQQTISAATLCISLECIYIAIYVTVVVNNETDVTEVVCFAVMSTKFIN